MEFPTELDRQLQDLLKSEYAEFKAAMGSSPHGGLRFHSGKIKGGEAEELALTRQVPWAEHGYYAETSALAKHPFYHGGIFYLQEPSAMLPAEVLHPQKGDWVLDLCAAPGGKSTRLAELLAGTGFLVANDISNNRCRGLLRNMERFGMTNAVVTNETPQRLARYFGAVFDKVLVDAPCSGQGMFRKDPKLLREYTERKDRDFPQWQRDILSTAAELTAPGGDLVYSTCTFTKNENEEIIAGFLEKHGAFSLVDIPKAHGFSDGVDGIKEAVRLYPHRVKGEGHFVAHLKREGEATPHTGIFVKESVSTPQALTDFCAENEIRLPCGTVLEHRGGLYLRPLNAPVIEGLKVVGAGTYLGDVKNRRLHPSHPFALSLTKEDTVPTLVYPCRAREVADYLKGLTLRGNAKKGYHLLFADNFPLGWVKSDGRSVLKNHYPKAWRNL